ncbi:hypothetical protein GCM10023082_09710 [Streptomyces tremellae]|uniref:Uncharacterized protein n=1 Tax=Streptomyces tremellae TaxID=1124239 RepID=A0ABP7E9G7_9ACTN
MVRVARGEQFGRLAREGAHLVEGGAPVERHQDVQPAGARGHQGGGQADLFEEFAEPPGRPP